MHKTLANLLCIALLLSACTATTPYSGDLEQAPPRKPANSLQLPVDATLGPVIAGLAQGAVPQGMTRLPSAPATTVLTSHYADDGGPSRLVLIDWGTGSVTGTVSLIEPGGAAHVGHVGGIAADQHSLWVASDAYLYRGDIAPLVHGNSGSDYPLAEQITTEATYEVAFCSVYNDLVWAGEFALDDKYPTDPSHHLKARDGTLRRGWISGYDPDSGFEHPQQVLSIPDRAQGMYATDDYIYLSISYGRRHRSRVEIHRNPLSTPPHRMAQTSKGKTVPLWFLDATTELRSIDLPPMSQNLIVIDGQLAVLFESGASKFRFFGKKPLDHIVLLPLEGEPQ
jgi:hypothetical protein